MDPCTLTPWVVKCSNREGEGETVPLGRHTPMLVPTSLPQVPTPNLLTSSSPPPPGVDCVIVKSGRRVCGTGGALASAPLVQDKSYFEVKVQCGGEELDTR